MRYFIRLHHTQVSVNDNPSFNEILVNISEITTIGPTAHKGCNAEVSLKTDVFRHPLYCREHFGDIIDLLKEKGIDIISLKGQ